MLFLLYFTDVELYEMWENNYDAAMSKCRDIFSRAAEYWMGSL
jgi:hypothetical protein